MVKSLSIAIITVFFSVDVLAWSIFGPKNFDECILENMKGVTSDIAAKAIGDSCYTKFPEIINCKTVEVINPRDLYKITGTAEVGSYAYFQARLYNGLDKAIAEITFTISGEKINPPQQYKLYPSPPNPLQPKSAGNFGTSIQSVPGKNFKWDITSVKVCE